jgi:hypothetical protein
LTSFERRFLKEFVEKFYVLVKTALYAFESIFKSNGFARMEDTSHLHASMPHVEMLANFLVLLLPICLLASLGTIQGGLA